jgi:hypothetical protein
VVSLVYDKNYEILSCDQKDSGLERLRVKVGAHMGEPAGISVQYLSKPEQETKNPAFHMLSQSGMRLSLICVHAFLIYQ